MTDYAHTAPDNGQLTIDRRWIVGILTLLLHVLFLVLPWSQILPLGHRAGAPVKVSMVDPQKLEEIRAQIQKRMLLDQKDRPAADKADPSARYFSERNVRVDKETRAKETQVIPQNRPGTFSPNTAAPARPRGDTGIRPLPNLSQLGVPFRVKNAAKQAENSENKNPAAESRPNGGDQALNDSTIPEGERNALNTEQSVYYSYYSRLYEAIGPIWQSRINNVRPDQTIYPGVYVTQVDVIFNKAGNLRGIRYLKRSPVAQFDDAVEFSWRKIGRFPNPPAGLLNDDGLIHTGWTFSVHVDQKMQVDFRPPQRVY
ncbi:MAG: TonB C-terminal domain-containing protein [Bacteriovoracia bacterium]